MEGPLVVTGQGRELVVRVRKFGLSKRGSRGKVVLKRGTIDKWTRPAQIQLGPASKSASTVADGGEE